MTRTRKGSPRCPEGHDCTWCGGKVSAERRDVRQAHDPSDGEECTAYDVWVENEIDEAMRAYHAEQCDESEFWRNARKSAESLRGQPRWVRAGFSALSPSGGER